MLLGILTALLVTGVVALALWGPPPAWRWAREHLLTVEFAGLLIGIAGLVVSFLVSRRAHDVTGKERQARDRAVMLKRVRNWWIKDVLDRSLTQEVRIRLGLTRRPEIIAPPAMLIRRPGQAAEPLSAGTPVSEVFAELGGGLLILGAPGSGKTTALLELARDLLECAEADQIQPIPVVFSLSSWAVRQPPLAQWLIDELRVRYDVARSIAERWVAGNEILPLLDGLDEVAKTHRAGCVEAINAFQAERGPVRLVVCSRTEEYTEITRLLRAEEAIELRPPTREQVSGYLQAAGAALADVQAALDADETLWGFLQSPLVLNIVALTYQNRPAEALRAAGTPEQRLALLFAAYTERMFEHRPVATRYTPVRMLHWLAWLARSMREHGQSEFHLDRLQPSWLQSTTAARLVILIPALLSGLIGGLVVGLVSERVMQLGAEMGLQLGLGPVGERAGLRVGLIAGLVFALVAIGGSGLASERVGGLRWPWLGWDWAAGWASGWAWDRSPHWSPG
jgi:DNA polymerase III delta prime subunit